MFYGALLLRPVVESESCLTCSVCGAKQQKRPDVHNIALAIKLRSPPPPKKCQFWGFSTDEQCFLILGPSREGGGKPNSADKNFMDTQTFLSQAGNCDKLQETQATLTVMQLPHPPRETITEIIRITIWSVWPGNWWEMTEASKNSSKSAKSRFWDPQQVGLKYRGFLCFWPAYSPLSAAGIPPSLLIKPLPQGFPTTCLQ